MVIVNKYGILLLWLLLGWCGRKVSKNFENMAEVLHGDDDDDDDNDDILRMTDCNHHDVL